MADMVRDWLKRDELTEEVFDILDCIGKGYSFTEIIWDTSEGDWRPVRLERRDPRWFRFDRVDLTTPMKLDANGQEVPLNPFQFIYAQIKAKSGLPSRAGLARVAAWGWMFKAFTQRDWAIFTQTYGQPLRVGKWAQGASEDDKATLFDAVANIAGDCAAIMPESMTIDFIESANVGSAHKLYLERSDWLDKQISKAVLGQTGTTDSVVGGLGSGKEHREVQEDLERADAKALSTILNRDLIRPWVDLEYGPQKRYPRLKIARPEVEDLEALSSALGVLVPLGLKVGASEVRDKFGLSEPKKGDEILTIAPNVDGNTPPPPDATDEKARESAVKYPFNTRRDKSRPSAALRAETPPAARTAPISFEAILAGRLSEDGKPAMAAMLAQIQPERVYLMITDVIARLEAKIPTLAKRVEGAAQFAELMKSGVLPTQDVSAYVLPLGLLGGKAEAGAGFYTQLFDEAVGVVLALKSYSSTGDRVLPDLRILVGEVLEAVAGWAPNEEVGVFRMTRASLVSMSAGTLIYQIDFTVTDQLRIIP